MIYGYARCSTNETKQDISRQIRELKKLGATDKSIYREYESGTKSNRAELNKLLDIVKAGDVIVTTEVSRITRSTKQLCEIIQLCKDKQLKLIIQNSITIDCTSGELDPMTNAFLQMSGVFAELERNIISSRIKSGLANRKAKGEPLGRQRTTVENIPDTFMRYYDKYCKCDINKSELARLSGITRPTCYKYIKILTKWEKNNLN